MTMKLLGSIEASDKAKKKNDNDYFINLAEGTRKEVSS